MGAPSYLLSAGYVLSDLPHSLTYVTQPRWEPGPVCVPRTARVAVHRDSLSFICLRGQGLLCLVPEKVPGSASLSRKALQMTTEWTNPRFL